MDSLHCYERCRSSAGYPQLQQLPRCRRSGYPGCRRTGTSVPTDAACGACHDDVNFVTGVNHGPGIPTDNTECVTCHASNPDFRDRGAPGAPHAWQSNGSRITASISWRSFSGPTLARRAQRQVLGDRSVERRPALRSRQRSGPGDEQRCGFTSLGNTVDYSNAGAGTDNAQPPPSTERMSTPAAGWIPR